MTQKETIALIKKHLPTAHEDSIKYYLSKGDVSGTFYIALDNMIKEAEQHDRKPQALEEIKEDADQLVGLIKDLMKVLSLYKEDGIYSIDAVSSVYKLCADYFGISLNKPGDNINAALS